MLLILALVVSSLLLLCSSIIYSLCKHLVRSMETAFARSDPIDCIVLCEILAKLLVPAIVVLPWIVSLVVHVVALMPSSPFLITLL